MNIGKFVKLDSVIRIGNEEVYTWLEDKYNYMINSAKVSPEADEVFLKYGYKKYSIPGDCKQEYVPFEIPRRDCYYIRSWIHNQEDNLPHCFKLV